MKFIFDQTVGSVMNIVLFIVLINLLKGEGPIRAWELVVEVRGIHLCSAVLLPLLYYSTSRSPVQTGAADRYCV
jgi:hypothetical protein